MAILEAGRSFVSLPNSQAVPHLPLDRGPFRSLGGRVDQQHHVSDRRLKIAAADVPLHLLHEVIEQSGDEEIAAEAVPNDQKLVRIGFAIWVFLVCRERTFDGAKSRENMWGNRLTDGLAIKQRRSSKQ